MDFDDDDDDAGIVSGIFNTCDKWCERCEMTHRCRLALDEATVDAMTADGSDKAAAWEALLRGYDGVRDEVEGAGEDGAAELFGFDPSLDTEDFAEEEARRERAAANHPCAKGGREYGMRCHEFLESEQTSEAFSSRGWKLEDLQGRNSPAGAGELAGQVWDALQVLGFYSFQIGVKLQRAADGLGEEVDPEIEALPDYVPDAECSAKVALMGIDRSLAAWAVVREAVPGLAEAIFRLMLDLDAVRRVTEQTFPGARELKRPGFER